MIIAIDARSPVPAFEQLRAQLASMIASGVIAPGERLPTIRQLANDLELAPGTVVRAFRELERDDYLTSKGRKGTFVSHRLPAQRTLDPDRLASNADEFVRAAKHMGATPADIKKAVDAALLKTDDEKSL